MYLKHIRRQTPAPILALVKRTVRLLFRHVVQPMVAGDPGPLRRSADALGKRLVQGVRRQNTVIGGLAAAWLVPADPLDDLVILYAHGGGFAIGSCDSHASICSQIAAASRRRVLVYDYRLTPEHPYPAAVEDALAAYQALLASGRSAATIVLAGDSAGGALTLELLLAAREQQLPLPRAAIANCPWVDYESLCPSLAIPGDAFLTRELMAAFGAAAFPDAGLRRRSSLLKRDYGALPPIYLLIGGRDPLHDEDLLLAERLQLAGNAGRAEVWEDMPHVWQGLVPFLAEATLVTESMAEFIDHC